jgi:hypothetical protein
VDVGAIEKHITGHWFIDPKRDMQKLAEKNKEAHRRANVLLDALKGAK